ncbi:MAG TPA: helix-turn-helix transcriptional regulator [Peptococcaceae bacterium]|nr:helix-turn-helix transcriptional regulator [Peptococcaceae bacterium]
MGFEIITKLRKEKGLTLKQLSEKSGVPLGTLNKIVNGITKDPKLDTLKAISKVLDCTLDDFDDETFDENRIELSEKEINLLKKWNMLSEENQNRIMGMIEIKLSEQEEMG